MMKNITNMTTLPICWNPTHGLRPICRIFRNKQKSRGVVKKDVKKFIKMINKTSFSGVTINRKTHWKIAWEMLDTDGNITKPLQPAFRVHKNGTKQTNIALNSHVDITFSTEVFDVGSNFASNTFTVPSGKGGKYFIYAQIRWNESADFEGIRLTIRKNSTNHFSTWGRNEYYQNQYVGEHKNAGDVHRSLFYRMDLKISDQKRDLRSMSVF